jgi:hypothetical protein
MASLPDLRLLAGTTIPNYGGIDRFGHILRGSDDAITICRRMHWERQRLGHGLGFLPDGICGLLREIIE